MQWCFIVLRWLHVLLYELDAMLKWLHHVFSWTQINVQLVASCLCSNSTCHLRPRSSCSYFLKPNISSCLYYLKPKLHLILFYFVKLCLSSYSTFRTWKFIFFLFSLNPTTFHYEKSHLLKTHLATKVQKTTHVQLLCNYPLKIWGIDK